MDVVSSSRWQHSLPGDFDEYHLLYSHQRALIRADEQINDCFALPFVDAPLKREQMISS